MQKNKYCSNTKCPERMQCKPYIMALRNRIKPKDCDRFEIRINRKTKKVVCNGYETFQ